MFALALSNYSQSPESASNVVYSFTAFLSELTQYNYDLGDSDCLTITPLSLLPNIHICCPGSNGSRVAICSMTCTYQKLSYYWLSSLSFSHRQHFILIWRVATDFLIWTKLCEVVDSSEVLKMKIHYEVVYNDISFISRLLMVFTVLSASLLLRKYHGLLVVWVKPYLAANYLYSWDEYGSLLSDTTSWSTHP